MNPLTPSHFYVDNSMLDIITTCPWKAYASILRRRRLAGESPPLRFGGFMHRALGYRYKISGFDQPFDEAKMLKVLEHWFVTYPLETEGWRNLDNATKIVRAYNRAWPSEDFTVLRDSRGLPYVEQPFSIETGVTVRGRHIVYIGRIDLVNRLHNGQIFTFDHKTTSMLGDSFWQDQAVTAQHPGYCWSFKQATGIEPDGYEINAICGRESIQNAIFDDNLGQVISLNARSKAAPVEFARQRFYTKIPGGQLDEWFQNMLAQCDEFLYHVDRDSFPRHRKHCVGKYGLCEFYNVCSLPAESREAALDSSGYEHNDWTPLYL